MQNLTSAPSAKSSTTFLYSTLQDLGITLYQALTMIIASKISSSLSLVGSIYILQDILRDPEKRNESIYHRTMLGMAGSDFIYAFGFFLGTWPQPKGQNILAIGNDVTCDVVAFLILFGNILSPFYNCSLATYYLL